MAEPTIVRRRGQHGIQPLSVSTRRRVLTDLAARAESGDLAAAEVLVRLSLVAEQLRRASPDAAAASCGIAVNAP